MLPASWKMMRSENDVLEAELVDDVFTWFTLVLNSDGSFTYTP